MMGLWTCKWAVAGAMRRKLLIFAPNPNLLIFCIEYGDEKASRKIAKTIVERRKTQKFETTSDLAGVIRSVVRPDKSGIDPATRSFQALRIAVNEELADIEAALTQAAEMLTPGRAAGGRELSFAGRPYCEDVFWPRPAGARRLPRAMTRPGLRSRRRRLRLLTTRGSAAQRCRDARQPARAQRETAGDGKAGGMHDHPSLHHHHQPALRALGRHDVRGQASEPDAGCAAFRHRTRRRRRTSRVSACCRRNGRWRRIPRAWPRWPRSLPGCSR